MTTARTELVSAQGSFAWLRGLHIYLGATLIGHSLWEILHVPLYTIWTTGTPREQAFAVFHCTLGDLLIATSTLILVLILAGDHSWPQRRFLPVAVLTIISGVVYTAYSEWLNVAVRASWGYSERMPVISMFGLNIGLSPLLQWIVVPTAAFKIMRELTEEEGHAST